MLHLLTMLAKLSFCPNWIGSFKRFG